MPDTEYPLGCVIMASGAARRFGSNKLLAEYNGKPLLCYALELTDELFEDRWVISSSDDVRKLARQHNVFSMIPDGPYQSDTVSKGIESMDLYMIINLLRGILFCVSDQPLLTRASLRRLCDDFMHHQNCICRLAYGEHAGNPIIFPLDLVSELRNLPQDKGGSWLAKKYPERVRLVQVQDKRELFDIDTEEDLEKLAVFSGVQNA